MARQVLGEAVDAPGPRRARTAGRASEARTSNRRCTPPGTMRGFGDRWDIDKADERVGDHLRDHRRDIRRRARRRRARRDPRCRRRAGRPSRSARRGCRADPRAATRCRRSTGARTTTRRRVGVTTRVVARSSAACPLDGDARDGGRPAGDRLELDERGLEALAGCRRRSVGTSRRPSIASSTDGRSAYARTDARLIGATRSAPSRVRRDRVPLARSKSRGRRVWSWSGRAAAPSVKNGAVPGIRCRTRRARARCAAAGCTWRRAPNATARRS